MAAAVGCRRCGDCCRAVAVRVPDPDGWLERHGLAVTEGGVVISFMAECRYLVTHEDGTTSCADYPDRPEWCRQYLCDRIE